MRYVRLRRRLALWWLGSIPADSATDLQKAIDLAKQASELSKRGIFAGESVKNKADELLKANAKRLSDYYRSLL